MIGEYRARPRDLDHVFRPRRGRCSGRPSLTLPRPAQGVTTVERETTSARNMTPGKSEMILRARGIGERERPVENLWCSGTPRRGTRGVGWKEVGVFLTIFRPIVQAR